LGGGGGGVVRKFLILKVGGGWNKFENLCARE